MKKRILIILIGLLVFNCISTFGQTKLASENRVKIDSLQNANSLKQDSLFEAALIAKASRLEILNLENQKEIQDLAIKEQEAKAKTQRLLLLISLVVIILLTGLTIRLFNKNRKLQKILDSQKLK